MSIPIRKAARFVEVLGSHANPQSKSVDILFGGADEAKYAIEIDPAIVEALMVAIQAETTRLRSILPENETSGRQALLVKDMSAAMSDRGDLAWKLTLEGGLEVNLAFSTADFDELYRQMEDVRQLLHTRRQ